MSVPRSHDIYCVGVGTSHAEVLAALHGESFDEGWSAESLDTTLRMPGSYGFVALRMSDDEPLGFALFRAAAGEAEVLTIATRPHARGRGVGKRLMGLGCDLAKELGAEKMFLEVAADNAAALALYRTLGFHNVGTRVKYYSRKDDLSVDAVVMALDLRA